jgi:rhodanese-related sulfurtransferase
MSRNTRRDQYAVTWGFILILGVCILTTWRWYSAGSSDSSSSANSRGTTATGLTSEKATLITPDALKKRLLDTSLTSKTFLIDLRTPKDFATQHIIGSTNATAETISGVIPSIRPADALIILINNANADAPTQSLATQLTRDHMTTVVLAGGFEAWTKDLGPTISAGDPTSLVDASKVIVVSPEEVKKLLDTHANSFTLIDTRFAESFRTSHIPGAINIPLEQLEARRNDIPLGRSIIVYNDSPVPGFQSAVRLFDLNVLGARVIEGGFSAWKDKNYPVE